MAKQGMAKSVIILIILAGGISGIFAVKKVLARNTLAARIAALSPRGTPQGIEDLRKAIDLYERKIEEHVKDAAQTGIYWKILGNRLIDKKLYGEALEALENAARYYPEDETIQYLIGISAGTLAKSEHVSPQRKQALREECELAYLRAIEIYERYGKALYGLSVLYVFELGRPAEAVPYLERLLEVHRGDTDGMFVLAAAYYMTENYQAAVDLYDRIGGLTKDKDVKIQAERNKGQVMDEWYR